MSDAVADAMKVEALECPDCHATFAKPAQYMDHRIGERFAQAVSEVKAPTPETLLTECKDGICKMVSEHVEATYNVTKKGDKVEKEPEARGLFSTEDEPE